MKRLLPLASALTLALLVSPLLAQPSISRVSPGAVTPGKTVDLVISGAKFTEPLSLWTSFGGKVQITTDAAGKKAGNKIQCKVTLPADVPVGVGGIFVGTAGGASDVFLILIDDMTSVADNGKNITAATAQEIKLPIAVDGTAQAGTSDFYKFAAKKGQSVSFEVVAQRIGSSFDGVMWLRDAAGNELAYSDDDEGLGTDCRFAQTFAADGQYVVEVRDNRYLAGQRYRLRIGDFPLVSTTYPAGGQIGSTAQVGFAGPAAKGTAPMNVTIPAQHSGSRLTVGAKFPGGQTSGIATLAASRLPEVMESEPNNDAKVATVVALPCALNGRLETMGDIDFYEFLAKKGQRFDFKAVSRSLGSPSFAFVRIYNAAEKKVAETKVGTSDETTLAYNIPADGVYRVSVEDLLRRGGPDHVYRIEIAPPTSGFTLSIKNVKNAGKYKYLAAQKGAFAVEVTSKRAGYNGPITLSVEGAPGAVQLRYNIIAEKKNETKMIISLAPGTAPGQMLPLRIVGTATVGTKQVRATAATVGIVQIKMPQLAYPPAWIDGILAVATSTEIPAFYAAPAPAEPVFFPNVLGTTQFTITPKRTDKTFKAGLSIQSETLPAGYTAAVKVVGKVPAEKYEVTLTGPKNAPAGKQTIRLLSYAEHKGKGQVVSTDVAVQVVTPLTLTVAPAGLIAPGQKQKVKVTAVRFAGDKKSPPQPITLTWKKLPPGVTGAKFTIPANKSEIEVELTAAATAKDVKFTQLTVEAATKFQGKDLKLNSKPVALEIKKPVAKKPVVKKPVAKKPEVKKPAAKKPAAKKPEVKKPAAKKPEVKKPQPPKK